jgi:hypothetical protein
MAFNYGKIYDSKKKIPIFLDDFMEKKGSRRSNKKSVRESKKNAMERITPEFTFLHNQDKNGDVENEKKENPKDKIDFMQVLKAPYEVKTQVIEVIPRENDKEKIQPFLKKTELYTQPEQEKKDQPPVYEKKPPMFEKKPFQEQPYQPQQPFKQPYQPQQPYQQPYQPPLKYERPPVIPEKRRESTIKLSSSIKRKKSLLKKKYDYEMQDIDKNKLSLKKIKLNREKVKIKMEAEKLKGIKQQIKDEKKKLKEEKQKLKEFAKGNKAVTISKNCDETLLLELKEKDKKIKQITDDLKKEKDVKDEMDTKGKLMIEKIQKDNQEIKAELSKMTNLYNNCKSIIEKNKKQEPPRNPQNPQNPPQIQKPQNQPNQKQFQQPQQQKPQQPQQPQKQYIK